MTPITSAAGTARSAHAEVPPVEWQLSATVTDTLAIAKVEFYAWDVNGNVGSSAASTTTVHSARAASHRTVPRKG